MHNRIAAQQIAARQAEKLNKQQIQQQKQQGEQAANQQNIQALTNTYQNLLQQEEELLAAIGQIKDAKELARPEVGDSTVGV